MKYIYGILFGILLIGCQKDLVGPDPIPPPTVSKPQILSFSVDKSNLVYGESTIAKWEVKDAESLSLGGKDITNVASFLLIERLVRDTTLVIIATNKGGSASKSLDIKVGDWTTSDLGLISHGEWMVKSIRYFRDGVVLADLVISDDQKKDRNTFTLDGKVTFNGQFSCYWNFSLTPGRIMVGPQDCSYTLTKTEFARSMVSQYGGQPAIYEVTLTRI